MGLLEFISDIEHSSLYPLWKGYFQWFDIRKQGSHIYRENQLLVVPIASPVTEILQFLYIKFIREGVGGFYPCHPMHVWDLKQNSI